MNHQAVLIDAYSQIFRAFYAIRQLTNDRGEPTNAIYLFTKILLKIEEDYPADLGALLFDCGKIQARLAVNPLYKANREAMPEELKNQIPIIREMAEAFGWKLLQMPEFEADDLIAGFARKLHCPVRIVTSDKDLMQLIDERVSIVAPAKSGGFEERGRQETVEKFGVPPELLGDFLSLLGDHADNIAGVPGIGPKGAAELLTKFGPADNWLDHPEKLAGTKFEAKIREHAKTFRDNRSIIRLNAELPEEFRDRDETELLEKKPPDWDKIRELCLTMQIRSLLKLLPEGEPCAPKPDMVPAEPLYEDDLFGIPSVPASRPAKETAAVTGTEMVQGELF